MDSRTCWLKDPNKFASAAARAATAAPAAVATESKKEEKCYVMFRYDEYII